MNYNINRLEHMIDACEKILKFTDVDYTEYEHSEEKQAAVARYFEILGEAYAPQYSLENSNFPS